ncbi:MAG: FliH/SctL family protein [Steroidobacteraceae bacterium]
MFKAATPFVASETLRRRDNDGTASFAARHFAIRRAGFLLREHAKQMAAPSQFASDVAIITPADDIPELLSDLAIEPIGDSSSEELVDLMPLESGPSEEEIAARITEAEERGRNAALAEMASALDAAMIALDAAARELSEKQALLERDLVVPLARASLDIGAQIARQNLQSEVGLGRYLQVVQATLEESLDSALGEGQVIIARLHPEDVALLERANERPVNIRLQSDPLVARGGVILGAGDKVIDDRFENRVREVREAALAAAAEVMRDAS